MHDDGSGGVRIAELVATLSYAADLGLGQPMDHCLRQTVIAGRLAELTGATERERATTFYLGLLMNSHCHADAAEQAAWFADDIAFKGEGVETLGMNTAQLLAFFMRRIGSHGSAADRARRLVTFPLTGQQLVLGFMTTRWASRSVINFCTAGTWPEQQVRMKRWLLAWRTRPTR
jgi:hypothetical protein